MSRKKEAREALSNEDKARGRTNNSAKMKTARQALSEEDKARCRRDDNNRKKTARQMKTKHCIMRGGQKTKENQEDWKMKNNLV